MESFNNHYSFDYSQYKAKLNKKPNTNFLWLFLFIVLLLAACVFIKPMKFVFVKFYFIEVGNFQNYNQTIKFSKDLEQNIGKTFVYYDGVYHIFSSVHYSKETTSKLYVNLYGLYYRN